MSIMHYLLHKLDDILSQITPQNDFVFFFYSCCMIIVTISCVSHHSSCMQ